MPLLSVVGEEAWLWLGGSWLIAVLWTNLAWLFSPWADAEKPPGPSTSLPETIVFRVVNWPSAPTLFQALRFIYFVGLPFAALLWGRDAVVARHLGLKSLILPSEPARALEGSLSTNWSSWINDLGWAAVVGLGSLALLLLAGLTYHRALRDLTRQDPDVKTPGWHTLRETVYEEIHWAFYRNAPIAMLGAYEGTWVGLALVGLEAGLNPMWRDALRIPGRAWSRLSQGALAVVSAVVFLRTQNLWLALLLHWSIAATLEAAYGGNLPMPSSTTPPRD